MYISDAIRNRMAERPGTAARMTPQFTLTASPALLLQGTSAQEDGRKFQISSFLLLNYGCRFSREESY